MVGSSRSCADCGPPAGTEPRSKLFLPGPDYSLVYLDSFEFVPARCKELAAVSKGQPSAEHERFVAVCSRLGLPLNQSKRLPGSLGATLQGGEFDGRMGVFAHARQRVLRLAAAGLVLA